MTRFLPIFLALLAGCATAPSSKKSVDFPTKPQKKIVATAKPEAPPQAKLLPLSARIVGGQKEFRFVIIDFTNGRRPQLDEKLGVYRVGQKVGEIRVSGPFGQDTTVAADVLAGEAKYGDEVKAE
jgi:hypothetical protein